MVTSLIKPPAIGGTPMTMETSKWVWQNRFNPFLIFSKSLRSGKVLAVDLLRKISPSAFLVRVKGHGPRGKSDLKFRGLIWEFHGMYELVGFESEELDFHGIYIWDSMIKFTQQLEEQDLGSLQCWFLNAIECQWEKPRWRGDSLNKSMLIPLNSGQNPRGGEVTTVILSQLIRSEACKVMECGWGERCLVAPSRCSRDLWLVGALVAINFIFPLILGF